jgi:hypothetical protein
LLARGADMTMLDDRGKSALEIARAAGHENVVALLQLPSR